MGTTIIKNRQFRHVCLFVFFAKLTNPKGETTLKQPGWQYLSAILKLVNIINTPVHEILHRVLADNGIERVIYLDVSGKKTLHVFGLECLKIEGCPPS